jgi:Flp pilus assembly pilin Flp
MRIGALHTAILPPPARLPLTGDIGFDMPGAYWRPTARSGETQVNDNAGRLEMRTMLTRLRMLAEREDGQTMAEYAIVLTVVSVAAIAALLMVASSVSDVFNTVATIV